MCFILNFIEGSKFHAKLKIAIETFATVTVETTKPTLPFHVDIIIINFNTLQSSEKSH